jgi:hypothetical protein
MIFPPKEATQMSHDVKYIGMDVHKEAIVIAVLNGSGKLVIETIVETENERHRSIARERDEVSAGSQPVQRLVRQDVGSCSRGVAIYNKFAAKKDFGEWPMTRGKKQVNAPRGTCRGMGSGI